MAEQQTAEAPNEAPKEGADTSKVTAPEKESAATKNRISDIMNQSEGAKEEKKPFYVPKGAKKEAGFEETPWQYARNWTRDPLKKAAKIGLFAANPVVYSSVYAADWMAQRTPGVKNLYAPPREIIRGTADQAMNVVNGAVTLVPSTPATVLHEVEDKLLGMDTSVPTTIIGHIFDKLGDAGALTLNLSKSAMEKLVALTKQVGKPALEMGTNAIGTVISAPFQLVGSIFQGIGRIGGVAGLIGTLAFAAALGIGGHAMISATLPAISPAAFYAYQAAVDYISGLIGFL